MKQLFPLLSFLSLALSSLTLSAQSWDVEVGGYYLLNGDVLEQRDFEFALASPLITTVDSVLSQTIRTSNLSGSSFSSRASLSIGVGRVKEINERFSYRLGGGLMLRSLSRRDTFEFLSSEVLSEEVVPLESTPITFGTLCDAFTNSFDDILPVDPAETVRATFLSLNASLIYDINEVLSLTGGLEFKTPLFTLRSRELANIDIDEGQGETVCTWEREEIHDTSGNNFRNSNFAVNLGAIYNVSKEVSIQLGVSRDLRDMFSFEPNEVIATQQLNATEAFIKIRYQFKGSDNPISSGESR